MHASSRPGLKLAGVLVVKLQYSYVERLVWDSTIHVCKSAGLHMSIFPGYRVLWNVCKQSLSEEEKLLCMIKETENAV